MREAAERELAALAGGPRVPRPSEHAGDHARGDPARGLRRLGRARRAAARPAARPAGGDDLDARCRSQVLFGRTAAARARCASMAREIDALLLDEIAARRAAPGEDICSLLVAGALRGRHGDERPRDPRPADDAADGRARDDRHRPGVDARPARPPPGRARRARGPAARRTCARSSPSRCGCARSCRSPAAGSPPTSTSTASRSPRAPTSRPAMWLAHTRPEEYPGALRVPARALPRQAAVDLHLDPVRRRRAALHRRAVRRARDADRARRGPRPLRPPRRRPPAPRASPAATSRSRHATAPASSPTVKGPGPFD